MTKASQARAYIAEHPTATSRQIATALGLRERYTRRILKPPMRPPHVVDRVAAYIAEHPGAADVNEIGKALSLAPEKIANAFNLLRARERVASADPVFERVRFPPEVRAKMLPMLPGAGERRDDCAHYPEHVDRAGSATHGEAHCPTPCPQYKKRPREWDFAAAIQSREKASYAMHIRS